MRIAHINGTYGVGSTGRLIQDLVGWSFRNGDESRAFYSERGIDAPEAERFISAGARKLHAVQSRVSGLQGYWSKLATERLIGRLKAFSPDLLHLHVVHGNCLHLPLLFDYLHCSKLPVVITLHDCWWFTGRCVHPSAYQCEGFASGCRDCPAKSDCNPSWFFDRAEKMLADKRRWLLGTHRLAVAAVSEWLAGQAKRSFIPSEEIFRIYNWVNTDLFQPVENAGLKRTLGLEGRKVVLGVADIWDQRKGLDDLTALAAILPPEYRLVLVGKLPGGYHPAPNMLHIRHTDHAAQLARLYSMADVFVNPSRMETFGLTTAEALACGTPAIVYDATACPELIGADTGTVLPSRAKPGDLRDAVLALCGAEKKPEMCRKWVKEKFDRDNNCQRYYELYQRVLEIESAAR